MAGSQQDDGDFQSIPTKRQMNKKRLYIGNLPVEAEALEDKLVELLKGTAVDCQLDRQDVEVMCSKSCHALVSCPNNVMDDLIQKLNKTYFEGKRLVVQRERKPRKDYQTVNAFTKSWAKPTTKTMAPEPEEPAATKEQISDPPRDLQEVSERIGVIVQDEMGQAAENGGDALMNAAIASTAAVSLLADLGFGVVDAETQVSTPTQATSVPVDVVEDGGFMALCKQPLSSLMGEYGDYDPNWKQVEPTTTTDAPTPALEPEKTPTATTTTATAKPALDVKNPNSVLGMQGKMPVHVEFTSFGYLHGAPSEIRRGWSHSQPLAPFDCRHLAPAPNYLQWQDGLSGAVKRSLVFPMDEMAPSIKEYVKQVAEEVAVVLSEAIKEGGHGYAMPLRMMIYIGSDSGRHRSVVACELAATALRKLLRANKDGRFAQPCSVGTKHRHVQRRQSRDSRSKPSKQNALEAD